MQIIVEDIGTVSKNLKKKKCELKIRGIKTVNTAKISQNALKSPGYVKRN